MTAPTQPTGGLTPGVSYDITLIKWARGLHLEWAETAKPESKKHVVGCTPSHVRDYTMKPVEKLYTRHDRGSRFMDSAHHQMNGTVAVLELFTAHTQEEQDSLRRACP